MFGRKVIIKFNIILNGNLQNSIQDITNSVQSILKGDKQVKYDVVNIPKIIGNTKKKTKILKWYQTSSQNINEFIWGCAKKQLENEYILLIVQIKQCIKEFLAF